MQRYQRTKWRRNRVKMRKNKGLFESYCIVALKQIKTLFSDSHLRMKNATLTLNRTHETKWISMFRFLSFSCTICRSFVVIRNRTQPISERVLISHFTKNTFNNSPNWVIRYSDLKCFGNDCPFVLCIWHSMFPSAWASVAIEIFYCNFHLVCI